MGNLFVCCALLLATGAWGIDNPEEYVNIAIGSDTTDYWSYGNQVPVVGVPWGHTYFSPETNNERSGGAWWFHPWTSKLKGIRCTHQPSPWIGDWGWFRISFGYKDQGWDRWQGWDWRKADLRPYLFGSDLIGLSNREHGRARLDMTAGGHSSWVRMQFPKYSESAGLEQTRQIFIERNDLRYCEGIDAAPDRPPDADDWAFDIVDDKFIIKGFVDNHNGGGSIAYPEHYALRFYMELNKVPSDREYSSFSRGDYHTLEFDPIEEDASSGDYDVYDIKIAVSLISEAQAISNFEQEIGQKDFDTYLNEHKMIWNEYLSVANVVDTGFTEPDEIEANLVTFYSNLYRTLLYPRDLAEPVIEGGMTVQKHWSPFDPEGRIFDGPCSTDSGFWDAFHTVYTNMAMLWPEEATRTFKGFVNVFREGGWLPQWAAPHYKNSMVGTMSDVSVSDMICKHIMDDEDVENALEALHKDAFTEVREDEPYRGRRGLMDYREHGYIGRDTIDEHGGVHECVSRTQNHALADWAIRNAVACAEDLYGMDTSGIFSPEDLEDLEQDNHNWKNVMNSELFPQARWICNPDYNDLPEDCDPEAFVSKFDKYLWGFDLTEGGPYQFRLNAPHDIEGLAEMFAGYQGFEDGYRAVCAATHEMNTEPGYAHRGTHNYGQFIHEMSELPMNVWGQYSHNNQPHHEGQFIPIQAFNEWKDLNPDANAGEVKEMLEYCVHEAQYWIKKVLRELYTPLHYSGDEDNGEMAAWYIMNALGFYDIIPSSVEHQLGSPLFKSVEVKFGGNPVKIEVENHCPDCYRVCSITVGNQKLDSWKVTYDEMANAGTIIYSFAPGGSGGLCPDGVALEDAFSPPAASDP